MMEYRQSSNRSFAVLLAVATLAHLSMLLIPVVRQQAAESAETPTISIRFSRPEPLSPPPVPVPEPELFALEAVKPVELAELPEPAPPPAALPPIKHRITASRIISDLQEKRKADPLAAPSWERQPTRPDYYARHQPALEDVLNEPSLQLPFRDTRIYLVDSYDAGFTGGVQKFFDDVSVPFGFTTRNNTRVQCRWMLVLVGCGWGPLSYHDPAARPPKRNPNSL